MPLYSIQPDVEVEASIRKLRRQFRTAVVALVLTVIVSTIGFVLLGEYGNVPLPRRVFFAFWDTLNLVSTVGSLSTQLTPLQKVWGLMVIIFGLGAVLWGYSSLQGLIHGGDVRRHYARRTMERTLERLEGHIIVCGYGHVGREAARLLSRAGRIVVVIDIDEAAAQRADSDGLISVHGDAARDETLRRAGIVRATGLVAALESDELNVFLSLVVRELNPTLRVVTQAERPDTQGTLRRAGANRVIVPNELAGMQMSQMILKPRVSEFIDAAFGEGEFEFVEVPLDRHPEAVGRSLDDLALPSRVGAIVIGVVDGSGTHRFNPGGDYRVTADDTLIVMIEAGGGTRLDALIDA